jgi:hypothetical protein
VAHCELAKECKSQRQEGGDYRNWTICRPTSRPYSKRCWVVENLPAKPSLLPPAAGFRRWTCEKMAVFTFPFCDVHLQVLFDKTGLFLYLEIISYMLTGSRRNSLDDTSSYQGHGGREKQSKWHMRIWIAK